MTLAVLRGFAFLLLLITIVQREFEPVPWTLILPLIALVLVFAVWRAHAALYPFRHAAVAALFLAASLAISALPYLRPGRWSASGFAMIVAPAIAAWAFFLFMLADRPPTQDDTAYAGAKATGSDRWSVVALVAATLVLLTAAHWLIQQDYITHFDEPLYLLQGRLMREPGFVRQIDDALNPFFVLRQTVFGDGRFRTQYPPGQPAVLAAFAALGLRWWTGVLLSTAAVSFTYLLGRELFSRRAGLAAAALLAVNLLFVSYGTSYMPHAPSLAMATAAAWLLVRSERRPGWRRAAAWAGAGLLLGCTVTVRPLTGAAITASIVLWQMLRRQHRAIELAKLVAFLGLGSLLPILALLYYNDVTNGAPFVFGYTAAHGPLHDLGFGPRGFVVPDSLGRPITEQRDFTIRDAFNNTLAVVSDLDRIALPAFLLMPLVWIGWRRGYRFRWTTVAAFLVLPALQFFYFYPHTRFYLELFPFLFIALAGMLAYVARQDRRLAAGMVAAAVAVQLTLTTIDLHRRVTQRGDTLRYAAFTALREAAATRDRMLVFVDDEDGILMNWASWYNIDTFPGDVIVARDLGSDNIELMRRFRDHFPMHMSASGRAVRLNPLE